MKPETVDFLLNLNREFYDAYAQSFSSTRFSIQPGVQRLLPQLLEAKNLMDLGCGNGNLAQALLNSGYHGSYLGVDNSAKLLQEVRKAIPRAERDRFTFRQVDLASNFELHSDQPGCYHLACFAVIHHFPVEPYLDRFFSFAERTLTVHGKFFLSTWQVKNNLRLSNRIQPWAVIGLDEQDLSEDVLLLDWRADLSQPARFRYVHHYDSETLTKFGNDVGLVLEDEFYSDGKEGNLALYQVWRKV